MDIKKDRILETVKDLLKLKGKRKFTQSVELIINFRGIDFNKPENRLNLTVKLPKGRGKENKIAVFGDEQLIHEAKKLGIEYVFNIAELNNVDKNLIKKLCKDHVFLAQPKAMGLVAKQFGKILGPRGKIPTPIMGSLEENIKKMKDIIKLQNKGKYLPVLQTLVGIESMKPEELVENIMAVLEEITKKIPSGNIKNIYVKLTMSKPLKIR